ncbi:hypothetical protein AVEN_119046-1 [Araneus ventricosus]|uniref:Uncharacterized protein n=1 Tax=Araneus ventricosus TaxID=182803 RepID=A0A4Y2FFX5_ARAVE|nr:hypothetical protein AVEN_119046-1 [Araneus ventricosus]
MSCRVASHPAKETTDRQKDKNRGPAAGSFRSSPFRESNNKATTYLKIYPNQANDLRVMNPNLQYTKHITRSTHRKELNPALAKVTR